MSVDTYDALGGMWPDGRLRHADPRLDAQPVDQEMSAAIRAAVRAAYDDAARIVDAFGDAYSPAQMAAEIRRRIK